MRRYLSTPKGEDEDILEVKSVKQIRETFRQFKLIVEGMEAEMRHNLTTGASGVDGSIMDTTTGTVPVTVSNEILKYQKK